MTDQERKHLTARRLIGGAVAPVIATGNLEPRYIISALMELAMIASLATSKSDGIPEGKAIHRFDLQLDALSTDARNNVDKIYKSYGDFLKSLNIR